MDRHIKEQLHSASLRQTREAPVTVQVTSIPLPERPIRSPLSRTLLEGWSGSGGADDLPRPHATSNLFLYRRLTREKSTNIVTGNANELCRLHIGLGKKSLLRLAGPKRQGWRSRTAPAMANSTRLCGI